MWSVIRMHVTACMRLIGVTASRWVGFAVFFGWCWARSLISLLLQWIWSFHPPSVLPHGFISSVLCVLHNGLLMIPCNSQHVCIGGTASRWVRFADFFECCCACSLIRFLLHSLWICHPPFTRFNPTLILYQHTILFTDPQWSEARLICPGRLEVAAVCIGTVHQESSTHHRRACGSVRAEAAWARVWCICHVRCLHLVRLWACFGKHRGCGLAVPGSVTSLRQYARVHLPSARVADTPDEAAPTLCELFFVVWECAVLHMSPHYPWAGTDGSDMYCTIRSYA